MAKYGPDKKEFAKLLFTKEKLSSKEVADRANIPLRTIQEWIRKEKWEDFRTTLIMTKEEELRRLYAQLRELNDMIEGKPEGQRYANTKEADTLVKITSAIRQLETETSVAAIIDVAQAVVKWTRSFDIEKSKELTNLFDAFIKDKLR